MVVRAVILDFGGTLAEGGIDWNEYHEAILKTLKALGHDIDPGTLKKAIQAALNKLKKVRARGEELTFEEVYGSALSRLGVPPERETLEAIHEVFRRHYRQDLYPCIDDVLGRLSERYALALISNTMSDQPRLILERTGLARYFDIIVCSRDLGVRKPNPKIFEHVLGRLGVDPDEAVHVGDSVEADMEGASNAGLTPIWIRRPEPKPWRGHAISSVCDLPEFLEGLEKGCDNPA
jgi:HAD superfamily hydrolase (TIGR01549 family)